MKMRMTTDDAMEVHFGLRLLDRPQTTLTVIIIPVLTRLRELWHLQCWSSN